MDIACDVCILIVEESMGPIAGKIFRHLVICGDATCQSLADHLHLHYSSVRFRAAGRWPCCGVCSIRLPSGGLTRLLVWVLGRCIKFLWR